MKFSFVIPTFNHYDLLSQLLFDIYQKCSPVHEVIVVDDCSTDVTLANGLSWWKEQGFLPIRHLRLNRNVMFLRASNEGLKRSDGDVVCLISTDVRIYKDIVKEMLDIVSGSSSPVLIGGRMIDWDSGWNTFDGRTFKYLEGWLLATTRGAWEELFYFDEQFAPSDMEDVDLSTKALSLGYALLTLPSDATHHLGGQSIGFNPEREKITIANKEKFRLKWTTQNLNRK